MMKRIASAGCISSGLLLGWPLTDGAKGQECFNSYVEPPPPQYDFEHPGRLVEPTGDRTYVERACKSAYDRAMIQMPPNIIGCGYVLAIGPTAVIVYLVGCENIRRHEMGHVNGWAHPE